MASSRTASKRTPPTVVVVGHLFLVSVTYYLAMFILPNLVQNSPDDFVVAETLVTAIFGVHMFFLKDLTAYFPLLNSLIRLWHISYGLTMARLLPATHWRFGMAAVVGVTVLVRVMFASWYRIGTGAHLRCDVLPSSELKVVGF